LGQSQHMQRTPKSINVRFAPKATVSDRSAACRDGPRTTSRIAEKQRTFLSSAHREVGRRTSF
jgi:hypothetical protein